MESMKHPSPPLAATLVESDQHLLLAHVRAYRNGDARSLIRDVVDATFDASRELFDPAIKREMRLVDNASVSAGLNERVRSTAAAQLIVGSWHGARVGRRAAGSVDLEKQIRMATRRMA